MVERIPIEIVSRWIEEFTLIKPGETVKVPDHLQTVIMGMVSKESTFNSKAMRFEQNYEWLVSADSFSKKLEISLKTEIVLQSLSYGLMQIMGANCRAMGFKKSLTDLSNDPQLAFNFGIRYFLTQYDRYDGNIEKALAAYNTGSAKIFDGRLRGQAYADDVLNRSKKFQDKYGNIA